MVLGEASTASWELYQTVSTVYFILGISCLVPRPHYSARPKRFGSRGPSENVRPFPARSPRIRHRNELIDSDWENALQRLGKGISRTDLWSQGSSRYIFTMYFLINVNDTGKCSGLRWKLVGSI